jgi:hypothetical protein
MLFWTLSLTHYSTFNVDYVASLQLEAQEEVTDVHGKPGSAVQAL